MDITGLNHFHEKKHDDKWTIILTETNRYNFVCTKCFKAVLKQFFQLNKFSLFHGISIADLGLQEVNK